MTSTSGIVGCTPTGTRTYLVKLESMFCFRIGFLLQHDHPLPKYLLTTSSNGRYHPVQSRKAASKVYEVIKSWADFCLLENSSYVKFIRQVTWGLVIGQILIILTSN